MLLRWYGRNDIVDSVYTDLYQKQDEPEDDDDAKTNLRPTATIRAMVSLAAAPPQVRRRRRRVWCWDKSTQTTPPAACLIQRVPTIT